MAATYSFRTSRAGVATGWKDQCQVQASFGCAPDWVCEVLSVSTEQRDRGAKRGSDAEDSVGHLWLLDPRRQLLEVFALKDGSWSPTGSWRSDDVVSAPPFEAISISLADLWPLDRPLGFEEDPQHLFSGDR